MNNFVSKAQHGFLAKRSTVTNLLELMEDLTNNLNEKASTLVTYINFHKAFDKVCPAKLMLKIESLGIDGPLKACLISFLSGRSQRVKINGFLSETRTLCSGIPQGSVLGPLLFLIYLNDLTDILPVTVESKIYADDLKYYKKISVEDDIHVLSIALAKIEEWAAMWQMPFSLNKSSLMLFSSSYEYVSGDNLKLNDYILEATRESLDLGVIFQYDLKFTAHIDSVVKLGSVYTC